MFNGKPGNIIEIRREIRKGGCSSPLCFNFLPNELAIRIQESGEGVVVSGSKKVGILLYADDIVLLASSTWEILKLCEIVEKWLIDFNIKINAEKSEVVVYNGSARPQIRIGGEALKNANTFKYLGYIADKRFGMGQ